MNKLDLNIGHWLRIKDGSLSKDGQQIMSATSERTAEAAYTGLEYNYPKFFKMDLLCKWAWLAAETLLSAQDGHLYDDMDKNRIGLVLATAHGCIEVDKKYSETMMSHPSPALFVYTLPNIMLGEICIRHGLKGEQACLAEDAFNAGELHFWVNDLLANRGMQACLCGWVDVTADKEDISMYWVTASGNGIPFSFETLQMLHDK